MSDVDDFLYGGGGKAAKFEEIGDKVSGFVLDAKVTQQTSMEDNQPLTWSDGSPRNQLVVTLQTDERGGEDDDGQRRIYAKGGRYEVASGTGSSMKDAIADALKKANAKLSEGGKLTVAFTGMGKKTNRGFSAPKLYRALYEPAPKVAIDADDLFGS